MNSYQLNKKLARPKPTYRPKKTSFRLTASQVAMLDRYSNVDELLRWKALPLLRNESLRDATYLCIHTHGCTGGRVAHPEHVTVQLPDRAYRLIIELAIKSESTSSTVLRWLLDKTSTEMLDDVRYACVVLD